METALLLVSWALGVALFTGLGLGLTRERDTGTIALYWLAMFWPITLPVLVGLGVLLLVGYGAYRVGEKLSGSP
jgi:hypothetical protein